MSQFDLSSFRLLEIIENARKKTENEMRNKDIPTVNRILSNHLHSNLCYFNKDSNPYYCKIDRINIKDTIVQHDYDKSYIGGSLMLAGTPILKKRFVTQGSSIGTSIASKYLSKALPYKMPFKIYSVNMYGKLIATKNLGRGLGRLVPMVGTALLIIDTVELLIEIYEIDKRKNSVTFSGFGSGGSFGGGGASGRW